MGASQDSITLEMLDLNKIPLHIAIIMDGNGRWAKNKGLPRTWGHRKGMEALERTVKASMDLGVKYLTLYAFSTENWKRPEEEVGVLMNLLIEFVDKKINELNEKGVKVVHIGSKEHVAPKVEKKIRYAESLTQNNEKMILNLAFNYGSRQEIARAMQKIALKVAAGELKPEEIDERLIEQNLYTANMPDPDLLIRTGGEMRISNYLLWQIAYSEFWVTKKFWPDFAKEDLWQAVYDYQKRSRRFGGLDE